MRIILLFRGCWQVCAYHLIIQGMLTSLCVSSYYSGDADKSVGIILLFRRCWQVCGYHLIIQAMLTSLLPIKLSLCIWRKNSKTIYITKSTQPLFMLNKQHWRKFGSLLWISKFVSVSGLSHLFKFDEKVSTSLNSRE